MTGLSSKDTIYVSYNGVNEPLVQSQVLNYQKRLKLRGYNPLLLTFEDSAPTDEDLIRTALEKKGVRWTWRKKTKGPRAIGTFIDIIKGAWFLIRSSKKVSFIHCRSLIPTLMAMTAKRINGTKYLYDVRGFWAHEKRYKKRLGNPFCLLYTSTSPRDQRGSRMPSSA